MLLVILRKHSLSALSITKPGLVWHSIECMSVSSAIALGTRGGEIPSPFMDDFRAIYDQHLGFVFRTLRRFGVPEASLDDAMQDVFTIVHSKMAGFEGRSTLKTWIFGIARKVASKHRDKGREHLAEGDFDAQLDRRLTPGADTGAADSDRIQKAQLLYRLLENLDPELREIFLLVELEQFTMREAADLLNENQHTLASRLKRAKQDLQTALSRIQNQENWRQSCASKS